VASSAARSIVDVLLKNEADVNIANSAGETPLYRVASRRLLDIVRDMLQVYGANPNKGSPDKSPLAAACLMQNVKLVDTLLKHGADPNVADPNILLEDRYGQTQPLHIAVANGNCELAELLLKHGANIDVADSAGNTALHHVIEHYRPRLTSVRYFDEVVVSRNVKLVDMLLKHGANPNVASTSRYPHSKHNLPLFVAVDKGNTDIIRSLLNAGASVNAVNREGRTVVCFVTENLTGSRYYLSKEDAMKKLSTMRLLLQHGGNFHALMPDGHSPVNLAVTALAEAPGRRDWYRTCIVELLQLMVKHGAILLDSSSSQGADTRPIRRQSLNPLTLMALATFDGSQEFIVDLFRAGAGFQLIASCCTVVETIPWIPKSIHLCQAAVLAGYTPSAGELQHLQLAAVLENAEDGLMRQLVNWLNEERQQVPSLLRQCRIAIRQHLSVAAQYRTILPAIDKLPLPNNMKLYLQFDGTVTEVDLSVCKALPPPL